MTLIFGHRGAKAYYAENTLSSFEHAIDMGADGIELDVHVSKDGEVMVFHDFNLRRMCGVDGDISSFTKEELKSMRVSFMYQVEEIPTLEEVMQLIVNLQHRYNRKLWVNIELKAGSSLYPSIESAVLSIAMKHLPLDQVIFSSFDHYAIKTLNELNPECLTAILTASAMVDPWEYVQKLNAAFYHPAKETLNQSVLDAYADNDLKINVYTVNQPKQAKWLMMQGVHGIFTDKPDVMVEIKRTLRGNDENHT